MRDPDEQASPTRRTAAVIGGIVIALFAAAATAVGTGLGNSLLDVFRNDSLKRDPSLVSSSAREQVDQCGTSLFLKRREAARVIGNQVTPRDWPAFRRQTHAAIADQDVVQVSIQGESARVITLTGIKFEAVRRHRPAGAVFSAPCGGGITGRFIRANLDRQPAAIVNSSSGEPVDKSGSINPGRPKRLQADQISLDGVGR